MADNNREKPKSDPNAPRKQKPPRRSGAERGGAEGSAFGAAVAVDAEAGDDSGRECLVVGVGASAGALDAFKRLLRTLPPDSGMAFVLVQHLDPSHESMMAKLLAKHTAMPIIQVDDATVIEPNTVYMIPPNKFIRIQGNGLFLDQPVRRRGVRLPIDYFFASLADERHERAVGVVLSGTGSDGADGLRRIKAEGGMTIAQQLEDAEFDGMPSASVATGVVDRVLAIEDMAETLVAYGRHAYVGRRADESRLVATAPDHYRAILALLKAHTDRDFSGYKPGTIGRRIERRMGIRHLEETGEYLRLLRTDEAEVRDLFRDMLIGVTSFFRDADAWDELEDRLDRHLRGRADDEPVRVWVPGCATGEEAYSLAILLFELQRRHGRRWDLQIFASDIDRDAIDTARVGAYPENIAKDMSEERVQAFFQREGDRLRVKKALRESCIFAVQSLLTDPPFSNLDLISCRNLLIYLEPMIQQRLLSVFHFGLKPAGLLFLGNSESPKQRSKRFETLSHPARIYRRIGERRAGGGFPVLNELRLAGDTSLPTPSETPALPLGTVERSKKALLEEFAPASVVVDYRGRVQYIHGPVRNYLDFPSGEPQLDLAAMALDGLKAKTRTALHQARANNQTVSLLAPRVRRDGDDIAVRVRVHPLPGAKGSDQLFLVSFLDEPVPQSTSESGGPANAETDGGEDQLSRQLALELDATREDLQSTIEELESANEELKASNEEVMSMNEELQSANEELETSREELQSLNEELGTVNNQLHEKVGELEGITNDLANLLASTDMATLFLDDDLRIRRFTPATVQLMSLREGDIGRPLSDLASRVVDPELAEDARSVLRSLAPVQKEVRTEPDQWFLRRVTPFRTADNKIQGVVVTYSDLSGIKQAVRRLEQREQQQAVIARLGRGALAGDEPPALLERAVGMVATTLDVELVKVLRLEPGGRELRLVAGVGWHDGVVGSTRLSAGIESQAGYTLQAGGAVITRDLRREKRFRGPDLLTDHGVVSGMSVILGPEDQPWGVLGAHATREIEFTVDDTNFILAVANVLWEAIRRHDIEAELKSTQRRMAAFLDNSAVVAWMKGEDGRYIYLSRTYERRFGTRAEDCIGKVDAELWPAGVADGFRANDREVLESGSAMETVERAIGPDGEPLHFLVSKFPFTDADGQQCVGGLGVDITERVLAEEALSRSEERLRQAARLAGFGTYYGDLRSGLLCWSAELKALLGYAPDADIETAIGEVPDFVHRDDRARVAARIRASLDPAGDGRFQDEHRIVRSDGEERWVLMQGCTVFDGEGTGRQPREIAGTMLDITERHASEQELRDARERADNANAAKSLFLANMSHEIRTPLTAILGFADVLGARLDEEQDQACINTIKRNGAHLRQILDDVLDLARIEAGKLSVSPAPCNVIAVIGEIRSLFTAQAAQKGLSLTVEPRGPLPLIIETDAKCLRQILLNLVGNAVKFTERGGVRIGVECRTDEQVLAIEIIDTGVGIDQASLDAVFLPFEQRGRGGSQSSGGTGLGLAISRRLTQALGGSISADSWPEQGSVFRVRLPTGSLAQAEWATPDAAAFDGEPAPEESALPRLRGRVLVIDDQRDVRFLLHELLEGAGAQVLAAGDGGHGIALWRREREQGREIAVVLVDIRMPDMDGRAVTRELRRLGCRVPIIALTANAMQKDRDDALEAGCDGFLTKPIDGRGLLRTLAEWLGESGADGAPVDAGNAQSGDTVKAGAPADPRGDADAGPLQGLDILCVDDNVDACSMQKVLLEMYGHRVTVASGGSEALAAVAQQRPDAALIDLGLGDMSGIDLLAALKQRPDLDDCLFICVSGQDEGDVRWREAGFDLFLQKPVESGRLREVLATPRTMRP